MMDSSPYLPLRVEILGRADDSTAFAMVNRHWLDHLSSVEGFSVRSVQKPEDLCPEADVVIWHNWEDDFAELQAPGIGRFVVVRTWDFGPFPLAWARKVMRDCDRLWVHSRWIRDQATAAGISDDRVSVIPHGVDQEIFSPEGPAYPLPGGQRFRFLFVGASIRRKGFDLALRAFLSEFSPEEPVCFVAKDRPSDVFYEGLDHARKMKCEQAHLDSGSLVNIQTHLSSTSLAALYRSCDLSLCPYRAEGFGITILESMACGTPCIVPRFGACLDYCDEHNAIFVEPKRIQLPVRQSMVYNTLGFAVEVEEVDFCEVPVERLAKAMREAFNAGRESLSARSMAATRTVHGGFQWTHTIQRIVSELQKLAGRAPTDFASYD